MNIVQLTPGAGGMYCGNCLRDNALVAELRHQGHNTLMIPLYLPLTLDENNQSTGTPIFFSGVNVYLAQKFPWFRKAPQWLHRWMSSPALLKWAAGRAAKTRAEEVGDLTLSMFRGEDGNQARELNELIAWLKQQMRPDVICLSNAMLMGMARKLKTELDGRIACILTGEDSFLDSLPPRFREEAWKLLIQRAKDVDVFIAPSQFYADLMTRRLQLNPAQVKMVPNGINLDGYTDQPAANSAGPTLGFFARMCREKGLDLLVDAYIELRRRNKVLKLALKIGGGCGPADEPFVAEQRQKLAMAGVLEQVEFHPNLDREHKIAFLQSLTVFSVPALYGEAFGLYVIEAMAAGIPVVQPEVSSFPEIIKATGGGLLAPPNSTGLADRIQELLLNRSLAQQLGLAAQQSVRAQFSMRQMAAHMLTAWQTA